jgi:hypothetical protein
LLINGTGHPGNAATHHMQHRTEREDRDYDQRVDHHSGERLAPMAAGVKRRDCD